jgi:beta-phosphoglucomutase-like phosphatase (HAD superfamily)
MTCAELLARARALLFDFDGVLADSEPLYRESYNRAFAVCGHVIPEDEYYDHWTSKGEGAAGEIQRHALEGVDLAALERAQDVAYEEICRAGRVPLFAETPELLRRVLAGPRPALIASNSEPEMIALILAHGGAPQLPVVGGERFAPKPAPDIFLAAAARLGVAPADALVVEDSEKGLRAARAGGFPTLLVRNARNRGFALEADGETVGLGELLARL